MGKNDINTNKSEPELTEKQKDYVRLHWSDQNLMELTRNAFEDESLDGRSPEGKAVKNFVVKVLGGKIKTTERERVGEIKLKDEQKLYIDSNIDSSMGVLEMTRYLFKDAALTPLSAECRAVQKYVKNEYPDRTNPEEEIAEGDYSAPRAMSRVLSKINSYALAGWEGDNLSPHQKKCAEALKRYLSDYRLIRTINNYAHTKDREMVESTFIAYVYDKPGLPPEERALYLNLAEDQLYQITIKRQMDKLNNMLNKVTYNEDPDGKITMGLNEVLKNKASEYNQVVTRQKTLISDLSKRAIDRKKNEIEEKGTLVNLVEFFKAEEGRKTMARIARNKKQEIGDEVEKIRGFEDVMATVMGIDKDAILNN